jgi:(p)ppGpp synthase/HD superfamily hydrolase
MAMALARSAATHVGYHSGRALAAYLEWLRSSPPDVGHTTRAALGGRGRPMTIESRYRDQMSHDPARRPPSPVMLGDRFEQALQFATATHRTQRRKGSGIPYVGHLLGVCSLVIEDGGTEDEAIGALLHDAAEDHGGQAMLDEIEARFGARVATIVEGCTDTLESRKPPWCDRKRAYIEHLGCQPESVLRVSLADKLFNARAILRDHLEVREQLWTRFKAGREGQLWYYRQLADRFSELLPGRMAEELNEVVAELERVAIPD